MDQSRIVVRGRGEEDDDDDVIIIAANNDGHITRYVMLFPGMQVPVVMYVDDMFRDGFIDIHGIHIVDDERSIPPPPAPTQIPTASLIESTPQQGDTCAICLNNANMVTVINVEDDNTVSFIPHSSEPVWVSLRRCSHRFHRECVRQCRGVTCPMCRTPQV